MQDTYNTSINGAILPNLAMLTMWERGRARGDGWRLWASWTHMLMKQSEQITTSPEILIQNQQ